MAKNLAAECGQLGGAVEAERRRAGEAVAAAAQLGAEREVLRSEVGTLRAHLAELSQAARAHENEARDARAALADALSALADARDEGAQLRDNLAAAEASSEQRGRALLELQARQRAHTQGLTSALASLSQQLHGNAAEPGGELSGVLGDFGLGGVVAGAGSNWYEREAVLLQRATHAVAEVRRLSGEGASPL
ncbi:hypothetical protein T492DRAFT_960748, partial [Pavlovales sp. CCMP2436]